MAVNWKKEHMVDVRCMCPGACALPWLAALTQTWSTATVVAAYNSTVDQWYFPILCSFEAWLLSGDLMVFFLSVEQPTTHSNNYAPHPPCPAPPHFSVSQVWIVSMDWLTEIKSIFMAYMHRIQSFLIFRFMQFEPRNVIKHMQNSAFTMFTRQLQWHQPVEKLMVLEILNVCFWKTQTLRQA